MAGGWFDECTALNLWLEDQATGRFPSEKRVVVAGYDIDVATLKSSSK